MLTRLAALLLLPGCAWVTDAELAEAQGDCECPDAGLLHYPDQDGDGYGDDNAPTTCPTGEGFLTTAGDCNDDDASVHPGAEESCNGQDDDCDGETDDDDAVDAWRWYQDDDGDGYGDPDAWTMACDQPEGYVGSSDASDCDDGDASIYPGAGEECRDLVDNDCDGLPGTCRLEGDQVWDITSLRVQGGSAGDGTGQAMVGGMDLTGDGHADLTLGADGWDGGPRGMVAIFAGPFEKGDNVQMASAHTTLDGSSAEPGAGRSLAVMGDMDGHGQTWLAVGAAPQTPEGTAAGAVYLLRGPFSADTIELAATAEVVLDFAAEGDALGSALASGLDATGNGYPDLAVGAPGVMDDAGELLFFEGPISAFASRESAAGIVQGDAADDCLGTHLALVPDMNGDGLAELAVGAPYAGSSNQGEVLLFLSPLGTSFDRSSADQSYTGEAMNDLLGTVAAAGDVDADGRGDLLLSAPYGSEDQAGVVYLLLRASSLVSTVGNAEATIEGSVAGGTLGTGLAGLDDFDADGRSDLLLGAPKVDVPESDAGACYLFYGEVAGSHNSASADMVLAGPGAAAKSGSAIADLGDLDGDGFSDALIGAPSSSKGEAGLLLGTGW